MWCFAKDWIAIYIRRDLASAKAKRRWEASRSASFYLSGTRVASHHAFISSALYAPSHRAARRWEDKTTVDHRIAQQSFCSNHLSFHCLIAMAAIRPSVEATFPFEIFLRVGRTVIIFKVFDVFRANLYTCSQRSRGCVDVFFCPWSTMKDPAIRPAPGHPFMFFGLNIEIVIDAKGIEIRSGRRSQPFSYTDAFKSVLSLVFDNRPVKEELAILTSVYERCSREGPPIHWRGGADTLCIGSKLRTREQSEETETIATISTIEETPQPDSMPPSPTIEAGRSPIDDLGSLPDLLLLDTQSCSLDGGSNTRAPELEPWRRRSQRLAKARTRRAYLSSPPATQSGRAGKAAENAIRSGPTGRAALRKTVRRRASDAKGLSRR